MFDEIRYELNRVEIDRNRNIEITSTINFVNDKVLIALNAGWNSRSDTKEGHFNFYVSLNMLLNFCENYKRVIVNARLELILIWAQRLQLLGGKSCDGIWDWIIQSANASR